MVVPPSTMIFSFRKTSELSETKNSKMGAISFGFTILPIGDVLEKWSNKLFMASSLIPDFC